jgi:hypothetical protein
MGCGGSPRVASSPVRQWAKPGIGYLIPSGRRAAQQEWCLAEQKKESKVRSVGQNDLPMALTLTALHGSAAYSANVAGATATAHSVSAASAVPTAAAATYVVSTLAAATLAEAACGPAAAAGCTAGALGSPLSGAGAVSGRRLHLQIHGLGFLNFHRHRRLQQ